MPSNLRPNKTDLEQVFRSPAVAQPPPTDVSRTIRSPAQDDNDQFTTLLYTHKHATTQEMAKNPIPDAGEHTHAT